MGYINLEEIILPNGKIFKIGDTVTPFNCSRVKSLYGAAYGGGRYNSRPYISYGFNKRLGKPSKIVEIQNENNHDFATVLGLKNNQDRKILYISIENIYEALPYYEEGMSDEMRLLYLQLREKLPVEWTFENIRDRVYNYFGKGACGCITLKCEKPLEMYKYALKYYELLLIEYENWQFTFNGKQYKMPYNLIEDKKINEYIDIEDLILNSPYFE